MRLSTGKRIGQSGQELLTAAVFSFVLHVCAFAAIALFYISSSPRVYIPPFYEVKLVGPSGTMPQAEAPSPSAPAPKAAPAPVVRKPKAAPKTKLAHVKPQAKAPARSSRSAMPELGKAKPKPEKAAPEREIEQPHEQTAAPAAKPASAGSSPASEGVKSGSGSVTTSGGPGDFNQKFAWYLRSVSDKIEQNWKATPDVPDANVHIKFVITRSGWAEEKNMSIVEDKTTAKTFAFRQAAMRAIRASSPFPPLPEDFSRQSLELSIDLRAAD